MESTRPHDLIDAYLDQALSEKQKHELEQALVSSEEVRRIFWEHVQMHAQLRDVMLPAHGEQVVDAGRDMAITASTRATAPAGGRNIDLRPTPWARWLALAACVTIVAGVWWFNRPPAAGLGLRVVQAGGEWRVASGEGSQRTAVAGMEVRPGDRVVVGKGGKVALKYDGEATQIELQNATATFGVEKGGKRVDLAAGTLVCTAAPQKLPFEIKTPNAVARVVGTRFTLEAAAESTRIEVEAGVVRLTRSKDNASVDVPAGHEASVSSGADLQVKPTRPQGLLLDLDFEDQTLPQGSVGTVVDDPRVANSRFCVTGVLVKDYRLFRVNIRNGDQALFTYRQGAVLSFDYWVRKQTGAIDVYFWNDTRSVSPNLTLWDPVQEQWTHVALRLSDFKKEVRDGDIISDLTIQTTPGGNELFVDNIRIEMEEAR